MRRRFREVTEIEEIREIRDDTNTTVTTEEPEKHTKTLDEVWEKINQLFFYNDLASLSEEEFKAMKHLPNDEFQVNNVVYYTDENGYIINSRSIFNPII
jgi:hypothetical protein